MQGRGELSPSQMAQAGYHLDQDSTATYHCLKPESSSLAVFYLSLQDLMRNRNTTPPELLAAELRGKQSSHWQDSLEK